MFGSLGGFALLFIIEMHWMIEVAFSTQWKYLCKLKENVCHDYTLTCGMENEIFFVEQSVK